MALSSVHHATQQITFALAGLFEKGKKAQKKTYWGKNTRMHTRKRGCRRLHAHGKIISQQSLTLIAKWDFVAGVLERKHKHTYHKTELHKFNTISFCYPETLRKLHLLPLFSAPPPLFSTQLPNHFSVAAGGYFCIAFTARERVAVVLHFCSNIISVVRSWVAFYAFSLSRLSGPSSERKGNHTHTGKLELTHSQAAGWKCENASHTGQRDTVTFDQRPNNLC